MSKEPQVLVDSTRFGVVVAGADVRVVGELAVVFAADNLGQFAVGLQSHKAVHDVHSHLFELTSPRDVVLLVKSRLHFNEGENGLARFRRGDE